MFLTGVLLSTPEWLDEINGAVPPSQSSALASASRIWLAGCGSLATKVHLHIEKMAMVLSRIAQAVSPHLSKETCDVLGNQDESGLALPVPNQERLHQLQRLAGNVTKILASS